jgi:hypothetical protein
MDLIDFIADSRNVLFAAALLLMLFIALLEGVTSLMGAGLFNLIDALLPDVEIDVEMPEASPSALSRLLGWLHVGRVPVLVILVVFLTAFGLVGYGLQSLLLGITGSLWPGWLVAVAAVFGALPVVRFASGAVRRLIPQDESSAISEEEYIGRIATVTLGTAKKGYPAEARLTDHYGQTHYLMVEPETDNLEFSQGEEVLLIERRAYLFLAIKNPHTALTDSNIKGVV